MEIISLFIGAIITWICTKYYYGQSTKELRDEARKLREETQKVRIMIGVLARWLHNTGISKDTFLYDEEGSLTGCVCHLKGKIAGTSGVEANIEVISDN